MTRLVLQCLGPLSLEEDGRPVHVTRRKALALLVYLAVTQRPHSRDALAALLWPDLGEQQARAMLRHALAALHHAIGTRWLTLAEDRVELAAQAGLVVDVVRFRNLLASVAAHHHSPYRHCDACIEALGEAAELCRGSFLAGFALPDASEFEIWQAAEAEAVQQELATALEQLAHVHAQAGRRQYTRAIDYARRWLALDPLHEPAHRALMRFQAWSGDRTAALQQYEACVNLLAREMGIPPDAETTALYTQIRAGTLAPPAPDGLKDSWPLPAADAAGIEASLADEHNLPVQPTPFIGRTHELAQIKARLVDPACRLLTLVGPGGIGKTRLAIEAARAQVANFRHGIWFVDLAPVSAVDVVPGVILRTLKVTERSAGAAQRQLASYLADKRLLLVVDNCEHLPDAALLWAALLHTAPGLKLLLTSRMRLNLREEWLEPVFGLEMPPEEEQAATAHEIGLPLFVFPPLTPVDLDAYDATRLFLDCVRRLRPDFEPQPDEIPLVIQICRRLDGMPLALELAASWVRVLSLADLAAEVEATVNLPGTSLQDMPERHRSIYAAIERSWWLLPPGKQQLLRQLSIFRGGFTRAAAEAVAGASLLDLASLVDQSWLQLQPSGRYVLHELTRQYCVERLADEACGTGEALAEAAHRRHCTYYLGLLHEEMHRMGYHHAVVDNVMAEFGNLHAAWSWTVGQGDLQAALDMVIYLLYVAEMMGWYSFVIRLYEAAKANLAARMATMDDAGRREAATVVLGWIEFCSGTLFGNLGLLEKCRACIENNRALLAGMAPGAGRNELQVMTEWLDALTLYFAGEFDRARRRFRKLIACCRRTPLEYAFAGDVHGATFWQANAHAALAWVAFSTGDYQQAKHDIGQAHALHERSGDGRFHALDHFLLSRMLALAGDEGAADEHAEAIRHHSEAAGDQIGVAYAHLARGHAVAAGGNSVLGKKQCELSLVAARRSGNHYLLMESLVQLGRIELALGRVDAAAAWFDEAIGVFAHLGTYHSNRVGAALLGLGWVALARQDRVGAERYFAEALAAAGPDAWEKLDAVAGMAHCQAMAGQAALAVEFATTVLNARESASATRDDVTRLMARIGATLPPADLQARSERRQARNRRTTR